jgi:hypothetical protein
MPRFGLITLVLSAVLLTACGGGGDSAQTPAPGTPENPLQALPNPSPTRVPPTSEAAIERRGSSDTTGESGADAMIRAQKRVQAHNERARARNATPSGRSSGRAAARARKQKAQEPSASRPCSLVSKTQARAIIGAAVLEPLEAPQGPTCIYQTKSGKPYVTLTVEKTSYSRLHEQTTRRRSIAVAHLRGVCGTFGRPMLYVPLSNGRVLSVAGPCELATRFAAQAIPHL